MISFLDVAPCSGDVSKLFFDKKHWDSLYGCKPSFSGAAAFAVSAYLLAIADVIGTSAPDPSNLQEKVIKGLPDPLRIWFANSLAFDNQDLWPTLLQPSDAFAAAARRVCWRLFNGCIGTSNTASAARDMRLRCTACLAERVMFDIAVGLLEQAWPTADATVSTALTAYLSKATNSESAFHGGDLPIFDPCAVGDTSAWCAATKVLECRECENCVTGASCCAADSARRITAGWHIFNSDETVLLHSHCVDAALTRNWQFYSVTTHKMAPQHVRCKVAATVSSIACRFPNVPLEIIMLIVQHFIYWPKAPRKHPAVCSMLPPLQAQDNLFFVKQAIFM